MLKLKIFASFKIILILNSKIKFGLILGVLETSDWLRMLIKIVSGSYSTFYPSIHSTTQPNC
ncbi:hypothetical protein HZS_1063 [Henneguya salminicola]|nr:hypothetical protein HZS_1063 [Henneguya salminicola]